MTRVNRARRRYILLRSEVPLTPRGRRTLERALVRGRGVPLKSIIWYEDGVILRVNHRDVAVLRDSLDGLECDGSPIRTVAVSGAIGKLKRLLRRTDVAKVGEVLQ